MFLILSKSNIALHTLKPRCPFVSPITYNKSSLEKELIETTFL